MDEHRSISGYYRYKSVLNDIISHEQYIELREYALQKGISLSDFKEFTGDIRDIKEIIDKIEIVSQDFPRIVDKRHHVILGLHYEDSEEFAGTESNKITLNGIFYNDTVITAAYEEKMSQGYFVYGTSWKDIIYHELGHVVSNIYRVNSLEIAMNLMHTKLRAEVAEYVAQNVSLYAARSYESILSGRMEFDGSEIIAECFCAYYGGTENIFAESFVKECMKFCKEVES